MKLIDSIRKISQRRTLRAHAYGVPIFSTNFEAVQIERFRSTMADK